MRSSGQLAMSSSGAHLQIEPGDLRRAHAVEREAALVIGVDQLVARRRRLRQDAQPARTDRCARTPRARRRESRPAHAVKAVATGDRVAAKLELLALAPEANRAVTPIDVVRASRRSTSNRMSAAAASRALDQILHHFLLAVDGDGAPAGELGEVDAMAGAAEAQLDAVVNEPFPLQPLDRRPRRSADRRCPAPARRRARAARRTLGSCFPE